MEESLYIQYTWNTEFTYNAVNNTRKNIIESEYQINCRWKQESLLKQLRQTVLNLKFKENQNPVQMMENTWNSSFT